MVQGTGNWELGTEPRRSQAQSGSPLRYETQNWELRTGCRVQGTDIQVIIKTGLVKGDCNGRLVHTPAASQILSLI